MDSTASPAVLFLDRRVASCSLGAGLVVAPVPKEDPNGAPALHVTLSGSQMPRGSSRGYGDEAKGLLSGNSEGQAEVVWKEGKEGRIFSEKK